MSITEDYLAEYIAEIAASRKRIAQQAADRARANGMDPVAASLLASELWTPGAAHEPIVIHVAGEFRRSA